MSKESRLAELQIVIDNAYRMKRKEHVRQYHKEYDVEMLYPGSNNMCYYRNNSVLTFEYKDEIYVVPYTTGIEDVLIRNGFFERAMYVPFSNGEYPIDRIDDYNRVFHKNIALVPVV